MSPTDTTAKSQTEAISFEFDLQHAPEKVWRALTDPDLLAEWLLPVIGFKLEPGAAFTFKTQAYPGWDGTVNCQMLEIEAQRKLSYTLGRRPSWSTVVTFTLDAHGVGHAPSPRAVGLQAGPEAGARRLALRLEDDGRQTGRPARENVMNKWTRQIHRWLSIAFTLTVIANIVVMSVRPGQPPAWVTYSPLLPLALLMFSGLYLFVLPYSTRWRSGRRIDASQTLETR